MKKSFLIAAATVAALCTLPLAACNSKQENRSKYVISAQYDESGGKLNASTEFTYYNSTENVIDCLKFNLWGNAYREGATYKPVSDAYFAKAYYGGKSYGSEEISEVSGCTEWEVCGEDENILSVVLEAPVMPEETAKVTINYTLDLAKVNHRTGITSKTVNLGNFYPILCAYSVEGFVETPYYSNGDPFVSECADYSVTFKLPPEYAAATSGKEVDRTEEDGSVITTYELKNARDFAAVLSKQFKTETRAVGNTEVTIYYLGNNLPEMQLKAACQSVEYFNATFGSYPYPTLSVVMTPLYVSGMEYPALTMISSDLDESDSVYTTVHETAHQWWYAAVGSDQVNAAFMDEGLAEYSTLCFFEANPEFGFTRTALLGSAIKAYRAYYSVYNQIFGKADTSMKRSLKDFASEYEYVNIAYNKGVLMFESVRTAMGDKKFFTALSTYYKENLFKIASCEELLSRFVKLHDVEGIFASYIDGKVII